jgi:hypothetical protein
MTIARDYQSSVTVSDGRIFSIGGSRSGGYGGKNGEMYDPVKNYWSLLPGCSVASMLTADKSRCIPRGQPWLTFRLEERVPVSSWLQQSNGPVRHDWHW